MSEASEDALILDRRGSATILAQRDRIELGRQLERCFAQSVDVLLTPTEPMTATPRVGRRRI